MSTLSAVVPLAEAKSKLSELVDRVGRGEEFTITRHDTEIARLVPVKRPSRANLADAIATLREGRKKRTATTAEVMAWRAEGRR
jgi:prevent-host-death family protein